jgi:hypothetical protein
LASACQPLASSIPDDARPIYCLEPSLLERGDRRIAGVEEDALLRAFGFAVLADLDGRRQFLPFANCRHLAARGEEVERPVAPDEAPQRVIELVAQQSRKMLVTAARGDHAAETGDRAGEMLRHGILGLRQLPRVGDPRPQIGNELRILAAGEIAGGKTHQASTDVEDLDDRIECKVDDLSATSWKEIDQATFLQRPDRFAHRPAADAVKRSQFLLTDPFSTAIFAIDDGVADIVGDLLRDGARTFATPAWRGLRFPVKSGVIHFPPRRHAMSQR